MELVFTDAKVRRFYREQRRRQLDLMASIRSKIGGPRHAEKRTRSTYSPWSAPPTRLRKGSYAIWDSTVRW